MADTAPARATNRQRVEATVARYMQMMDPTGANAERYTKLFASMDDKAFDRYMHELRDGKRQLVIYAPNMKNNLHIDNLLKAAKALKCKLFERLRLWDPIGHRYYLTPMRYLVLPLPVRRLKQSLASKISIPESDKKIDMLTGQVVKPDKGASVSMPEMQAMASKGLFKTIIELTNIRGGNVEGYATFKAALVETGNVSLSEISSETRVRSADVANAYLKSMMIDNNL